MVTNSFRREKKSKENTERCRKCQAVILLKELVENNHICPNCGAMLAEEGAMVGFAGAGNIGIKFSKEFQTAEFQKEHGFIDAIVSRNDIKNYFAVILELHKRKLARNV